MEGEEEEEKRSDTPERKDKDDLEEKDGRKDTKQKEELDPEEKEQDTAEVKGAHANLDLDKVDSTEEKNSEIKSGEVPRVNGESEDAGSDVSLLSPKRHLERQVKTSSCLLKVYSSFFCLFFILTASCHPHFLVSWKMLNLAESPA